MLSFEDIFPVENKGKTKVKFNMNDADPNKKAWDYLRNGPGDPDWIRINAHRKEKNVSNNLDNADYLLSFAQYYPYGSRYYIFGGYYKIVSKNREVKDDTGYELELQDEFKEYIGCLIIELKEPIGRNVYARKYNSVVSGKLAPRIYEISSDSKRYLFDGYENVSLLHKELRSILNDNYWKEQLSKVKGVYCVTDTSTGELYIGSASSSNEGIWHRWKAYADAKDLTGGNKEFEAIKERDPNAILNHFRYTILEIFDMKADAYKIRARESYWKKALDTRKHGMNRN